ncbi:sodium:solute symporter [Streptococcus pluranimalium]|uniref:sodium:solute symporter n=1 Tax=Streptococcus pluranimalium TaxID=82348 RepID=UPI00241521DC|nr:sodium:solute symporter [Streptococcus pluranimalium]WFM80068.1 sodium:solute symporter [Streptococcus pluranimalium]
MDKVSFGALNWFMIIFYLGIMLLVGAYFTKKSSQSTDAFFKANGKVPSWAAGLSVYATTLSSITFMAVPERSFLTDWSYAVGTLTIFLIIPLMAKYFIPFFRRLHVTTAYEYLEARFSTTLRAMSSFLFVIYHLGRMAVVIYLPVLAITSVTDINPFLIAAIVGLLCVIYTFLGGIEGVIWSDAIQSIILLAGAFLVIVVGLMKVDGGLVTLLTDTVEHQKFISLNNNFNMANLASFIPLIFIGQFANTLYQYAGSQDVVQRFLTTKSTKEAVQSLWTSGWLSLSAIPLFFGMGTVLYSFYTHTGQLPEDFNTSAIVPYFIVTQLPAGLAGLVIAAIFAAAQSTISSSLNAISSCFVVDFKQRFFNNHLKSMSDVWLARWVIIIAGTISTLITLYFIAGNSSSTWDIFLAVSGMFGVPVVGLFVLGIFTTKANATGALLGFVSSVLISFIANNAKVSALLVAVLALVATVVFGYLFSLLFKGNKQLTNLTIHTLSDDLAED